MALLPQLAVTSAAASRSGVRVRRSFTASRCAPDLRDNSSVSPRRGFGPNGRSRSPSLRVPRHHLHTRPLRMAVAGVGSDVV